MVACWWPGSGDIVHISGRLETSLLKSDLTTHFCRQDQHAGAFDDRLRRVTDKPVTVETGNQKLMERAAEIDALRAANKRTVPSLLGLEKDTNPFLRADVTTVAEAVGLPSGSPVEVFSEVRTRKDNF